MYKLLSVIIANLLIVILAFSAFAQADPKQTLSAAEKTAIINKTLELLNKNYVVPETAQKMEVFVRERLKKNEYENIIEPSDFAIRLTEDLQSISKDRHLRVTFSPNVIPPNPEGGFAPTKEELEQNRRTQSRENFGVAKIDILKGNIGLIQFNYFTSPDWAGEIYTAAMNYLSGTDALIIDLRSNAGSMHSDAVPFFLSYFFGKSVRLSDTYWRPNDDTRQFWTYVQVPGKRYLNKPVYILTSRRTFSGGEELAYDMKVLKRATLIGELTGGGANGGGDQRINDHFSVFVPIGRYINPITKTNWEAVGVSPDIEIASNKALYKAQLQAIDQIQKQQMMPNGKNHSKTFKQNSTRI